MTILHLDFSPRPGSWSRQLSRDVVTRLLAMNPEMRVTYRDCGREPVPHPDSGYATALGSPAEPATADSSAGMALSEMLIAEVEKAEMVVVGTPVHNFTVPSGFKAWIDHVVRVKRTFDVTTSGKIGLLPDRPVYIACSSGGLLFGERATQPDFLTPYLRVALGCIGLRDIRILPLQGTAYLDAAMLADQHAALIASLSDDGSASRNQVG